MKILYCDAISDMRGHFGMNDARLCQALAQRGHDIVLVTNRIYPEKFLNKKPSFKIIEISNGALTLEKFFRAREKHPSYFYYGYFRNSFLIFKEALKIACELNVDVIHGTGIEFGTATLLMHIYAKNRLPIVWEVQAANFTFNTYSGNFFQKFYKSMQRRFFRTIIGSKIKGFAVLGDYQQEKLRTQLALKDEFPVHVIREGGNGSVKPVDITTAREKIGLQKLPDQNVFLFFGLLRRDKGIEYLLKAVSLLKKECSFILIVAGAPVHYHKEEIIFQVKNLGINDRVILRLDYIPESEVSNYFFVCDALVLPYTKIYAGGSGPLFNEGGACPHGKPAIVSNVSEMGSAVKKFKLGFVFKSENPSSIAAALKAFMCLTHSERKELSMNAYEFAKQNTWSARAEKYEQLYQKII